MIDLMVVSSDLRPHVLDTRVKRGAELSTDHHLVGKEGTVNTVYSGDGVLLTSTWDIVDRWKEYFEDLRNTTMHLPVRKQGLWTWEQTHVSPGLKLPRAVVVDSTLQHRVDIGDGAAGLADRSGVLERRVRQIVELRIQEEQCGFRPGHGTVNQLYTLSRTWRKAFDRVPRGVLWVLQEYGVPGPLIHTVHSLYDRCQSLVHIAGNDVVLLASSARDLQ
ncbi:hypothetical protein D4764_0161930 [Takifugu flavidus]|uniref:Uncharacterized protein n=1 Tax=Takifugu flavidus TaxID=433684 RepID=A0A5C6MJS3_9TELE|nr:hypothetical protein D4764_0161930 [Takifugu flavidus]